MEHGCRNFHYRSSLAKSCKLRELTLKFHRENYERKEGGEEPRLSSIEGGKKEKREGGGEEKRKGKKREKERRIGKHVVGREILRKLGTRLNRSDGGRVFLARFIDSVSARTNYGRFALPSVYIIKWCSKVSCSSSIYPPIPFV